MLRIHTWLNWPKCYLLNIQSRFDLYTKSFVCDLVFAQFPNWLHELYVCRLLKMKPLQNKNEIKSNVGMESFNYVKKLVVFV